MLNIINYYSALGVALPNGQSMRTVRPNNDRLSMGNEHAANAVLKLVVMRMGTYLIFIVMLIFSNCGTLIMI
jgi:hypothetical protein